MLFERPSGQNIRRSKICCHKVLWRSEITLFAVKLVVLKGEQREFGSLFIPIDRLFEDKHILSLCRGRRTHDPFDLRLRHAVGHVVVIVPSELRTG